MGASGGGMPSSDAGALGGGGQPSLPDAAAGLVMGSLAVAWMHGAANCSESTDPALQIHPYNATTYIIRQDKRAHIEMTSTPGVNYSYGSTFQPDEHVLELDAARVV